MSNVAVTTIPARAAAAATAVAASQTPGGAGILTINGTLASGGVATFDIGRRVSIASAANDSNHTFTITGTDRRGNPQSESLTGPNTGAVSSVLDYLTVTQVAISAAATGAITVGTNGTASTDWITDNPLVSSWAMSIGVVPGSGVTYSVEVTIDDPNAAANSGLTGQAQFSNAPGSVSPPQPFSPAAGLTGATTTQFAFIPSPIFAHRLTVTAGTTSTTMWSLQSGLTS